MESIDLNADNCFSVYPKFYLENPELKQRHESAMPSEDAYYYFPKGESIIKFNLKKPSRNLRRIYKLEFGDYSAFELEQLVKFNQLIEIYQRNKGIDFPPEWTEADNLRYIYSTNCNLPQSLKEMIEHFSWKKATFPISPSNKAIEVLNLGMMYIFGRDKEFRPIIICQANVFMKYEKDYTINEWIQASLILCEYAEKNILLPGHVETWNMITNVTKSNILFLPNSLKKVIQIIANNYRARLFANFIIGMSATMKFLYKLVCTFIDEVTVTKLKIIDNIHDGIMADLINLENFEERFGGKARDIIPGTDTLFPPCMPSLKFFLDNENKKDKLMSEEEYFKHYQKNELKIISPFFLKKLKAEREQKEKEEEEAQLQKTLREKEEKMKETERRYNQFDYEADYYQIETSKDSGSSNSIYKSNNYYPTDTVDNLSFREIKLFNDKKRTLNSVSPKIPSK